MNINKKVVSVDVLGTSNESVKVPDELDKPSVSFAPAYDDIQEKPESAKNINYAFTIVKLGPPSEDSLVPSEMTIALRSNLWDNMYLAVNPSSRLLVLRRIETMEEEPIQNCNFILKPEAQPIDREDILIRIIPADQGPIHRDDGTAEAEEVSLCLRFLGPSTEEKNVQDAWLEQLAILCAVEDDTESADGFSIAGKSGVPTSYLDTSHLMQRLDDMKGELDDAKDLLSHQYRESGLPKDVDSVQLIKAAKLLSIMCDCVYLRDLEFRHDVKKIMRKSKSIWNTLRNWIHGGDSKVPKELAKTIASLRDREDLAVKGIQEVATEMGLKYLPLANIAESDRLNANGPCCGAFYADGDKPFIVVAFKGTSHKPEWITNIKYAMIAGNAISPVRGHCHSGFLNGLFTSVPIGLTWNKKRLRHSIPFNMLTIQLARLVKHLHVKPSENNAEKKVQIWTTGHSLGGAYATVVWSALLNVPRPHHSTMRDLITFGAPRVGNDTFASTIDSIKERRNVWRFVNGDDAVTSVPGEAPIANVRYFHPGFPVKIKDGKVSLGRPDSEFGGLNPRIDTSLVGVWTEVFWLLTQHAGNPSKLEKSVSDHLLENYWSSLKDAVGPGERWPLPGGL